MASHGQQHRAKLAPLAVAFVLYAAVIGLLFALTDEVLEGDTLAIDTRILEAVYQLSSPVLDTAMKLVTMLGGALLVIILVLGLAALLAYRKMYRQSVVAAASVIGAGGLILVLKELFGRVRPDLLEHLVVEQSYSFPSGHSVASATLAALVIGFTWNTRWRYLGLFGGLVYMVAIGFSRLYLGVHYPSDVLAGWLIGGLWVTTVVAIEKYYRPKKV